MTLVVVHKLSTCDAFVVSDLDGVPRQAGVVRLAPKILVDGATTLARSLTYLFASFEQQISGASAGINAKGEDRAAAIESFVTELGPRVADGSLHLRSAKGVSDAEIAGLLEGASAGPPDLDAERSLLGSSVVAAATAARGDLAGARVAIEGLEPDRSSVLAELAAAGAVVVAVATTEGSIADPSGLDLDALAAALVEHGAAAPGHLDREVQASGAVFGADADVLLAGSKVGVVDHDVAAGVNATLVVPLAPVPVTAKALAVLRRSGTVVLPDFLSAAGPWFTAFAGTPSTAGDLRPVVADAVATVVGEVMAAGDGPLLGACVRAEAYLRSWRDELPFGRPLG